MKIYVAAEWSRSGKRKDRMKLSLPSKFLEKPVWVPGKRKDRTKLSLPSKFLEKLVWVPVILFGKTFIPSYMFDVLLC